MRALLRSRSHADPRQPMVLALVGEGLAGPGTQKYLQALFESPPRLDLRGAEGMLIELVLTDAGDSEVEPSARDPVQDGGALGDVDRMVQGEDASPDADPDPACPRRHVSGCHER